MSIKVNCGRIVNELKHAEKEVFSAQDIKNAMQKTGLMSRSSCLTYMGQKHHLYKFGFMIPVQGGWTFTEEVKHSTTITVQISPALLNEDVLKAIEKALRPFEGVVEVTNDWND